MRKTLVTSGLALIGCALAIAGCQGDFGTNSAAHTVHHMDDAGQPEVDAGQPEVDAGQQGCTRTQGYWKTHPEAWPVTSLEIGGVVYSRDALIDLMWTSTKGDASLILLKQLVAAKLNVLAGATSTGAIAEGDAWFAAQAGTELQLGISPSSPAGMDAVEIAGDLADYNEGTSGPGHCD